MLSRLTNKFFIFLSAVTALFLLNACVFSSLFYKNALVEYSLNNLFSVMLCFALQFLLVFLLFKFINSLKEKQLKIMTYLLFTLFIAVETVFLFFIYTIPNTDAYRCIDTAVGFLNGNYATVDASHPHYWYFCDFSNNNFFTIILYLYYKVFHINSSYVFFAKLLNAFLIFLAIVFAYFSAKLILGQKNAVKALAVFTLNPVFYTHIQWVYTLTFSLPVMMAILYFCLKVVKEVSLKKRIIYSAVLGLLATVGYLLRPTSVFVLIAFIVFAISRIKLKKEFFVKAGMVALSLLIAFSLSFLVIGNYSNARFEKTLKYNFPITHWVMMGLSENGELDKNDVFLTRSFGKTKSEKQKGNIKEIQRRFLQKSGKELFIHFEKKIKNTFSDGTYNIATRYNSSYAFSDLKPYTIGQKSALFSLYCQGFKVFSLIFSIIGILICLKRKKYILMPIVITILGGFVFYMFWESKQSYSLPFLLPELILSTFAISEFDRVKIFESTPKKVATSLTCLALILGIIFVPPIKQKNLEATNTSISFTSPKDVNYISKGVIKQEFISNIDIKRIAILAKNIRKNSVAKIKIVDESSNTVFSDKLLHKEFKIIKSKNKKKFRRCFVTANIKSNKKYTIIIKSKNINWLAKKTFGIENYEGDLFINNKKQSGDLLLSMR